MTLRAADKAQAWLQDRGRWDSPFSAGLRTRPTST
jgi:hypothetical protein